MGLGFRGSIVSTNLCDLGLQVAFRVLDVAFRAWGFRV